MSTKIDFSQVDRMADPLQAVGEMDAVRLQPAIQRLKNEALRRLQLETGQCVVDLGCGTGEDLRLLAERVAPGIAAGVDISSTMIAEAKRRTALNQSNIEYHQGDITLVPLAENSVDACWCERTLQHLQEPQIAVHEMFRILKPGGAVILLDTDWETFTIASDDRRLTRKVVQSFCDNITNSCAGRELAGYAHGAGFREISIFNETVVSRSLELLLTGLDFRSFLAQLEETPEYAGENLQQWISNLNTAENCGSFLFSVTLFGVFARK